MIDRLIKRGIIVVNSIFSKCIYNRAGKFVSGCADNFHRPGVAVPVGKHLGEVSSPDGSESVNADLRIVEFLGKHFIQLRNGKFLCVSGERIDKFKHTLIGSVGQRLNFGSWLFQIFYQNRAGPCS